LATLLGPVGAVVRYDGRPGAIFDQSKREKTAWFPVSWTER
jgi:hypothetical protein